MRRPLRGRGRPRHNVGRASSPVRLPKTACKCPNCRRASLATPSLSRRAWLLVGHWRGSGSRRRLSRAFASGAPRAHCRAATKLHGGPELRASRYMEGTASVPSHFFLLLEFKLSRTARKPPLPRQRRRFSAGSSEICPSRSARPGKFIYIIHAYAGVCFGSTCACRFAAPNAGSLILSCPVSRWPARRH